MPYKSRNTSVIDLQPSKKKLILSQRVRHNAESTSTLIESNHLNVACPHGMYTSLGLET